jgi:hypothetical protein
MEEGLPLPTAIEYVPWLKIIFDFFFWSFACYDCWIGFHNGVTASMSFLWNLNGFIEMIFLWIQICKFLSQLIVNF